jgi:hypothetical protein
LDIAHLRADSGTNSATFCDEFDRDSKKFASFLGQILECNADSKSFRKFIPHPGIGEFFYLFFWLAAMEGQPDSLSIIVRRSPEMICNIPK